MHEIKALSEKILDLRESMDKLIEKKGDLLDPEIMKLSKMIDNLVNEYEGYMIRKASNIT